MPGLLHHSQAKIVQELLIANSLGSSPADADPWPVYATKEPDTPDDVITVYNTVGIVGGNHQPDGEYWEENGIQVRVRCALDEVGYLKAKQIVNVLDTVILREPITVGGSTYCVHCINRSSDVLSLGTMVGSNRRLFTINALAFIREI